jgi:hypothetical protein
VSHEAEKAIKNEVAATKDKELIELLDYVINQPASEKTYENGTRDEGRNGTTLEDFMKDRNAIKAKLTRPHVIALRLYTTPAYSRINKPLVAETKHPLPYLVYFINDGCKKLREAVETNEMTTALWRGVKQVTIDDKFKERGGTHFSPMSTTSDLDVALKYGTCHAGSVIFKIIADNTLKHGAGLQWLSAFASEKEELYPPLTFLQPTKRMQTLTSEKTGAKVTIVEVTPDLSAT